MRQAAHDPRLDAPRRLELIARARDRVLNQAGDGADAHIAPWISRSWRRCLDMGHDPRHPVAFDLLGRAAMRRAREANRMLTEAARPVLHQLGLVLAQTRYFAILTNAAGVVVDVSGPIDQHDRRVALITRIGVDLSESSVGTTAIGAALAELQPVWLHRGEHFFDATSCYSCAGAPLFGPDGDCVGMLDLTGVDVPERPELQHLALQSARTIENRLVLGRRHALLLRLNWPGRDLGDDSDALIGLDADGLVTTSNGPARQLLPRLAGSGRGAPAAPCHASELFALPHEMLFDAASGHRVLLDLPLWSGLRVQAVALPAGQDPAGTGARPVAGTRLLGPAPRQLKDIETALIRKAVDASGGKVAQAAAQLGVSRATVYRKLGLRRS